MTTSLSIAQQLERQAVVLMESTIPRDMTCDQWRRRRSTALTPALYSARRRRKSRPQADDKR